MSDALTLSSGGILRSQYPPMTGMFIKISFRTRGTSPKKKTAKMPAVAPKAEAIVPLYLS